MGSARPDPGVAHGTKWAFGVQGPAMSGTRFVNKSTSNEPVGEASPSRSDPLALPVGTRIGAYTVEVALGSGGFGITYRVRHDTLNKQFALKEYFPRQFSYRDKASVQSTASSGKEYAWGLDRFIKEAQALAKFKHPAIVDVSDIFAANNTAYMVLSYEEAPNLTSGSTDWKHLPHRTSSTALSDRCSMHSSSFTATTCFIGISRPTTSSCAPIALRC